MVSKSHIEAPPMQIMYIMADLSARNEWVIFFVWINNE
jgi:hypothetical protein